MTFVAIKMFKDFRPSLVFRMASTNLILGGWVRVFAQRNNNFTWILVGFGIMSLSYPVFLSAVTLLCNKWMGDKERTFMIQICGLTIPVGTVISFALSGVIFSDSSKLMAETYTLMWIQNIWVTLFAGAFAMLVRDKPIRPPSAVATKDDPERKMLKIFKEAFKDRSYLLLVCVFGCIDGSFTSFSSIMSFLFNFYNVPGQPKIYTNSLISLYGGLTAIVGVFASMLTGCFLQKTHKYLLNTRVVCVMMSLTIALAIYTVPAGNQIVVGINLMFLGMFMVPIIPVSMNFGSELTFPLSPAMTNGSLLMVGYAVGAVLGVICTPLA